MEPVSGLSLTASAIYFATAALAVAAALASSGIERHRTHTWALIAIAVIFAVLAASRIIALEDVVRAELRDFLRSQHAYESRRQIQGLLVAIFVGVVLAIAGLTLKRMCSRVRGRRDRAVLVAAIAATGMIALVILRIISFHPIDALLYGPFKLNWIADVGFSFVVAGCAFYYIKVALSRR